MDKLIETDDIFMRAAEKYAERINHPLEINWLHDARDNLSYLHEKIMALKEVGAL